MLLLVGLGVSSAFAEPEASAPPGTQGYVPPHDAPHVPPELVAARRVPPGFTSYQGGWLTIVYPVAMRDKVQPLIAEADSFRKVLSTSLGRPVLLAGDKKEPPVWVIVARSPVEMVSFAPDGYPPPAYASGVAYSSIGLVLLTIDPVSPGQPHVLEEVFRHELAHVALYDAVGGAHVPRWFNEGFAVHVSGESSLARLQTLWVSTVGNTLIPLSTLDNGFPADSDRAAVAYAQSADIVRYLLRKQDTERFGSLLERVRPRAGKPGQPFEAAFNDAYGTSLSQLEFEWRADAAKRYTFWPVLFSGGFVWAGALVLFGLAWRRRRKHHHETLARWEREEAEEDRRRALAQNAVRVHIVVPGAESSIALREMGSEIDTEEVDEERPSGEMAPPSDRGVPKVRHEGSWYTLH
ncbi:MAG: hypothetical protein H6718_08950 [Polyangiaceae bacterium]|nr:hypothetical protein [Polyangiaceae bacterium]MCB9606471.1 hypothetical protein [Polyangiaceae bacterium]